MPAVAPREKDTEFKLRVATSELEAWRAAAEAEQETLSNWIRRQLRAVLASQEKKRNAKR